MRRRVYSGAKKARGARGEIEEERLRWEKEWPGQEAARSLEAQGYTRSCLEFDERKVKIEKKRFELEKRGARSGYGRTKADG